MMRTTPLVVLVVSASLLSGCVLADGFEGEPVPSTQQALESDLPGTWATLIANDNHPDVGIAFFLDFDDDQTLVFDLGGDQIVGAWAVTDDDRVRLRFTTGDRDGEELELDPVVSGGTVDRLEGEIEAEDGSAEESDSLTMVFRPQERALFDGDELVGQWDSVSDGGRASDLALHAEAEGDGGELVGSYGGYDLAGNYRAAIVGTPQTFPCERQGRVCWALAEAEESDLGDEGNPTLSLAGAIDVQEAQPDALYLPIFDFDGEWVIDGQVRARIEE